VDQNTLILADGSQSSAPFDEVVLAAAEAGFAGIGLSFDRFAGFVDRGWKPNDMKALLDANGVALMEVEVLRGYFTPPNRLTPATEARQAKNEELLWDIADRFDVRHVQIVGSIRDPQLVPDASEIFASLCDRCAEHGLRVALEFIPPSNIPDADTATRIITEAGRANGGFCVDSWHHFRGARDDEMLRRLPASQVVVIQLDDGTRVPSNDDYFYDTGHNRMIPGTGEFDLPAFLRTMTEIGVRAPISVEVFSDELQQLPCVDVAVQLAAATRALLPFPNETVG